VVVVVVVLPLAWGSWLAFDAVRARAELSSTSSLVGTLQEAVLAGDRDEATATLHELQLHAERARDATRGVHWTAAAALPWIGPNVTAVQVVADVVDDLATAALPALMTATQVIDPATMAPVDGRVDVGALELAAPTIVAADVVVTEAVARLEAINGSELWSPVAVPLDQVRGEIAAVARTTATAARAVQLLPAMLGADEPRDYLLLVQGNAELRATGGIAGSVSLVRVEGGAVTIVETRSGASLGDLPAPVLPLTDAELALFGEDLAADLRDVTFTPDFPRTAEVARAIWAQNVGGEVDGVISVDPGALALLLDDTGPVRLPGGPVAEAVGGRITADNAVQVLLNTVYLTEPDPVAQDAVVAGSAAATLGALVSGQGESAAAVEALAEVARQGRLMVWSAHPDEQDLLADTVLGGRLRGDAGGSPVIGVFLNDGTGAKLGYYLDTAIAVEELECRPDGSRLVAVTVTLTNTVSADALATLPASVTGGGAVVPVGEVRTTVLLYAPTDGLVEGVEAADGEPDVTSGVHDGLSVVGRTVQLAAGQSVTIEAQVTTGARFAGPLILRSTPVADGDTSVTAPSSCP
jgi:hypothetical protein